VILSGLVFFAWGEIYFHSFPSTCTEHLRLENSATTNAGLLYTAKGTAALLVPVANYMQQSSGSWDRVFVIARRREYPRLAARDRRFSKPWRKIGGRDTRRPPLALGTRAIYALLATARSSPQGMSFFLRTIPGSLVRYTCATCCGPWRIATHLLPVTERECFAKERRVFCALSCSSG